MKELLKEIKQNGEDLNPNNGSDYILETLNEKSIDTSDYVLSFSTQESIFLAKEELIVDNIKKVLVNFAEDIHIDLLRRFKIHSELLKSGSSFENLDIELCEGIDEEFEGFFLKLCDSIDKKTEGYFSHFSSFVYLEITNNLEQYSLEKLR